MLIALMLAIATVIPSPAAHHPHHCKDVDVLTTVTRPHQYQRGVPVAGITIFYCDRHGH